MFRYPPFNTPTFCNFAATSPSVVDRAEEEVRHALKNLPEHVAATFRGLATDIKMDQHSQRADSEARWDAVDGRLDHLTGLLQMLVGSKSSKGGRKAKAGKVFSQHFEPARTVLIMLGISQPQPPLLARTPIVMLSCQSPMSHHPSSLSHPQLHPFPTLPSTSPIRLLIRVQLIRSLSPSTRSQHLLAPISLRTPHCSLLAFPSTRDSL